jgi:hypothetical protein
MERLSIERDRRVGEILKGPRGIPSTTGHVRSCGNPGEPSPKAKYSLMTDSEPVPRGKGEKHPSEGSEIVPETV